MAIPGDRHVITGALFGAANRDRALRVKSSAHTHTYWSESLIGRSFLPVHVFSFSFLLSLVFPPQLGLPPPPPPHRPSGAAHRRKACFSPGSSTLGANLTVRTTPLLPRQQGGSFHDHVQRRSIRITGRRRRRRFCEMLARNTPKFEVERKEEDTRVEIYCAAKPELLLSTVSTLDTLGLDIQQCVVRCFNDFAMHASCSDVPTIPSMNSSLHQPTWMDSSSSSARSSLGTCTWNSLPPDN